MKSFLRSLKRQDGFTLVELMVVVAIIGLLSAVAIPNFKKYQAKAKVSEAKLQLSGLYMAQTAFFSDFNTFAGCLSYMGYDPSGEQAARYYGMGFAAAPVVPTTAYTAASNSGLNVTACPATAAAGTFYFAPGKGAGAAIGTVADITASAYDTTAGLTFTAGAAGVIDGSKTTSATNTSHLTVNQNKLMTVVAGREGY
jgi:type IV pilus assembly protein PilA